MKNMLVLIILNIISTSSLALTFDKPLLEHDDVIGENFMIEAKKGDTLWEIGYTYGISVMDLKLANKSLKNKNQYYTFKGGEQLIIPQQFILPDENLREGIVINMAELRLYYFDNENDLIYTYPVGMGKQSTRTPTMDVGIKKKVVGPYWYPPDSIKMRHFDSTGEVLPNVVKPGPNNPLGTHAIYLTKPKFLIHGNNKIRSIGGFVSSGCIRLYNKDIKELYHLVKLTDPVRIIHHSVKMGTLNNELYIESHPDVTIYEDNNHLNTVDIGSIINEHIEEFYFIDFDNLMYVIDSAKGVVTNVSDQEYEMTSRYHQIEYNFNQITDDDYNSRLSQQEDDWYEFSYEDDGEYIEVIRFY